MNKPPPCIFCGEPSSRRGEHVMTQWFLERYVGEGPFTYEISGEPILDRVGNPRTANHLPPDLLPVCDGNTSPNDCNGSLNRLYEVPSRGSVQAVVDRGEALETLLDVTNFARWWIKTILLLQHPSCRNAFPGIERRSWDLPASVYEGLIKGTLPPDVSLWLARSDDLRGDIQLPELMRVYLPTTFNPEGGGGKPASLLAGIRHMANRMLQIQLVAHPLCDFDHPFEPAGLVEKLWPEPSGKLDVNSLPILSSEGRRQLGALFVDAGVGSNLPANGWREFIEAVPDGSPLSSPVFVIPPASSGP